jgi:hypothetical protein
LAYAETTGIELDELNKILKSIRKRKEFGFTELYAEDGEDRWIVIGSMSPAKSVAAVKKSPLDLKQQRIATEELERREEQLRKDKNWRIVNQSSSTASEPVVKTVRPAMSAELDRELKNLPPLKEPDERLAELEALLERPGLTPEVVEYLKKLAHKAEEQVKKGANDAIDKSIKDQEFLLPYYQKKLAQANVTIKKLLEKRGPNYKAKISRTPYDEIMGEADFSKLPQKVALSPDHLYSLHYIANSTEMKDLIEIFRKASDSDKATMLQEIPKIGDVPQNLFSIRSDANAEWKKESLWSELKLSDGEKYGYTISQIQAVIKKEPGAITAVKNAIKSLADRYRK